MEKQKDFSRYEIARIIGARALQISMNAPLLVDIKKDELEKMNYNPLKIAEIEFNKGVLPITVKRPLPKKIEKKKEEKEEEPEVKETKITAKKQAEEAGEIMELAQPEDEEEPAAEAKPEEM